MSLCVGVCSGYCFSVLVSGLYSRINGIKQQASRVAYNCLPAAMRTSRDGIAPRLP
jgi:hypothetical protein